MLNIRTGLLLGSLILTPAIAVAQTPTPKPTPKPAPAAAVHSTTGTVKSVDATSLVITRPSGSVKEMTFALDSSTQKKGTVTVGASVQVRYKTEGKTNTATAVTVQTKKK